MKEGIVWCPHCGRPHKLVETYCTTTGKPLEQRVHRAHRGGVALGRSAYVGKTLDRKYRIVRRIGSGGMGEVFEAENLVLRRRVAIKLVSSSARVSEEAIARLRREASAISCLHHPNVCDVYDMGVLEDGKPYLVLEHLKGETLERRLAARRLTSSAAIEIFSQILSGLQMAHGVGIIHRDLKPANVFLVSRAGCGPLVKLLDFGFAKDVSGTLWRTITRPGMACGTPQYMSPEQLRAQPVDARSDVFAVGVMLFEALAGVHPFRGMSVLDIGTKIIRESAPRLRAVRPSVSPLLDDVVARALAKRPEDRFASALEMQRALLDEESDDDTPPSDTRPWPLPYLPTASPPSSH
jgi:serine/threonine-protein kinase